MRGYRGLSKKNGEVKNWLRQLTPTYIIIFLGLAEYYKMFVNGFASIASPLTSLMQNIIKFDILGDCERSFYVLKDWITFAPLLTLLEDTQGFVVYCDVFGVGLGCVLMEHGKVLITL